MNIWNEIKNLNGNTLRALDRHNPFEIIVVTDSAVIIMSKSSGKERPISREGVENAYRHLTVTGRLTLDELESEFTPRNPVYICAGYLAHPSGLGGGRQEFRWPIPLCWLLT